MTRRKSDMTYIPAKVVTESREEFREKLSRLPFVVSNERLAQKLQGWSIKGSSVASELFGYRQSLLGSSESVWCDPQLIEEAVAAFSDLLNKNLSVAVLRSRFSESFRCPRSFNQAVIRVSEPWILEALLKDEAIASKLSEKVDLELGSQKSWS